MGDTEPREKTAIQHTAIRSPRPMNGERSEPVGAGRLGADDRSDELLVSVFQSGEESAFRTLVERHQERIRNLVFSIIRDSSVVDDLAQEIFIKVYEALPTFRFESTFHTWLYRIAINKSRDELRRRRVRRLFSLQSFLEGDERSTDLSDKSEPPDPQLREILERSLFALPERFRLPVILKDIEGMSYEEISQVMRCEVGTVKSRLSRGRSMMRKMLKPLLEEQ